MTHRLIPAIHGRRLKTPTKVVCLLAVVTLTAGCPARTAVSAAGKVAGTAIKTTGKVVGTTVDVLTFSEAVPR